jgi:hypothetical protein
LVGAGDAQAAAAVGAQPRDVFSAEPHSAGGRSKRSGQDIEKRGLAGSVRADNTYYFMGAHREIDTIKHDQRAKTPANADCLQ